jgi:shikimate kinase
MGCGKSTVGPLLAGLLGARFVDIDALIVADAGGRSIPALFAEEGETAFRDRESRLIASVCDAPEPTVIATGGGAVLREENVACLRESASVIWLSARPDIILARTLRDRNRPLLAGAKTKEERQARVLSLLGERGPRYQAAAHLIVDTSDRSPLAVAREIERKVAKRR